MANQKYKNFEFYRQDDHNLILEQWQNKEILDLEGRIRGRGKPTGKFEMRLVHIGFYSTISGVMNKIIEMDLEATEVSEFNKKLEEHKVFCKNLFKNLDLPVEKTIKESVED